VDQSVATMGRQPLATTGKLIRSKNRISSIPGGAPFCEEQTNGSGGEYDPRGCGGDQAGRVPPGLVGRDGACLSLPQTQNG
jgi:hypothetical protein